jgi:hypothetical protein
MTAKGVISILMGWSVPASLSPAGVYGVFDLLVLAVIGFQAWSLFRGVRRAPIAARFGWASILRRMVLPMGWRLVAAGLAVGFAWMLASQLGASVLLIASTDLGVALIAIATLLLVNGGLRATRSAFSMRSTNRLPAAVGTRQMASVSLEEVANG